MSAADRKRALIIESLLEDETVPRSLAAAWRALRGAAHRYDRASLPKGKKEAGQFLAAAALVFSDEVADAAGMPKTLAEAHRRIADMEAAYQRQLDDLSAKVLEVTVELDLARCIPHFELGHR